jgi:hypothetical protein
MVEYASVRSSLYDIDTLVSQLNERAAEGWEVVQILSTGGDVTAVLRRSPEAEAPAVEDAGYGAVATPVALYDTGEYEVVAAEVVEDDGTVDEIIAVEETVNEDEGHAVPDAVADSIDEAASEPPGWAVAPVAVEETAPETVDAVPEAPAVVTDTVVADVVPEPEPGPVPEPPTEVAPVVAAAASEPPPAPEPTPAPPAPAPAAAPSIPAGWYPDPAVRFELRYWDGAAWTEHVARAGQMYTDPPVA